MRLAHLQLRQSAGSIRGHLRGLILALEKPLHLGREDLLHLDLEPRLELGSTFRPFVGGLPRLQ